MKQKYKVTYLVSCATILSSSSRAHTILRCALPVPLVSPRLAQRGGLALLLHLPLLLSQHRGAFELQLQLGGARRLCVRLRSRRCLLRAAPLGRAGNLPLALAALLFGLAMGGG